MKPNLDELKVAIKELKAITEGQFAHDSSYMKALETMISLAQSVIDKKLIEPMGREEIEKITNDTLQKSIGDKWGITGVKYKQANEIADALVGKVIKVFKNCSYDAIQDVFIDDKGDIYRKSNPTLTEEELERIIKDFILKNKDENNIIYDGSKKLAQAILKGVGR